jgi:amino acid permease
MHLTQEMKKLVATQVEVMNVKKLGTLSTYFSLLKGFISIGILYMPKNVKNGGWAFTLPVMIFSFFVTYYCIIKLLEAREKLPVGFSYSDITEKAIGKKGKYFADIFLALM